MGSGAQAQGSLGRVSIMSSMEAEVVKDVVTVIFDILTRPIIVLFNSSASYSFISRSKCETLRLGEPENVSYVVSLLLESRSVPLKILMIEFSTNVYVMEISDLYVILGMDWLGKYKAVIECDEQRVTLTGPKGRWLPI